MLGNIMLGPLEVVKFNPEDPETYPSICNVASDVERRFGFTGGELLLFYGGTYIAQLVKYLEGGPLDDIINS